ncbi:hypothetical protein U9M48_004384 [Paspalum notatum var. saurae]|uniref:Uncharacterized protein n=1 Tax=Paspalum notatum var. saurae TaxID=547442 RepID=A0AAQ3PKF3_PASNO
MFIAVVRDYVDVLDALLEIPGSAHGGAFGYNALHAAVRNGNSAIARRIMETRPELAREEGDDTNTPMHLAVLWGKIDVLRSPVMASLFSLLQLSKATLMSLEKF